jgi:polyhydroxybutyrate depolymerase
MKGKTISITQKLFLVWGIIVFSACSAAHNYADTRQYTLAIGESSRTFLVHLPKNPAATNPPLVIALHGGGTNGKTMERFSGLSEASERYGFVVAYPNGSGRLKGFLTWNAGSCCAYAERHGIDDVAFIRQLIEYMIKQYHIDPARVYCTGISNGAMMAYRLAAEIPDRIAAIAPVAGTLTIDPDSIHAPMPIIHFHGTDDRYVPYAGGHTWPGQPHARLFLGRTTTEISANDLMWEFFRSHVKRTSER